MSYKNLGISVLIGGVLYVALLFFLAQFGYEKIFSFIALDFVGAAFAAAGTYQSVNSRHRNKKIIVLSIFLILLCHYLLQLLIHRDFLAALNTGLLHRAILISFFGYAAAVTRINNIEARENNKIVSPQESYERAKHYKMNPVIRCCGVLMGFLFLFFPIMIIFDILRSKISGFTEISLIELILFGAILFVGVPLMGVFFLAYSIPGATPKFVLRYMEKKVKH